MNEWGKINNKRKKEREKEKRGRKVKEKRGIERVEERLRWAITIGDRD